MPALRFDHRRDGNEPCDSRHDICESAQEMERYFNMGVGMVAVLPPERAAPAIDCLTAAGHEAWVMGEVVPGDHRLRMTGQYRS
jgi:phosphoribosylaminoimidazole (AIR) synthetase